MWKKSQKWHHPWADAVHVDLWEICKSEHPAKLCLDYRLNDPVRWWASRELGLQKGTMLVKTETAVLTWRAHSIVRWATATALNSVFIHWLQFIRYPIPSWDSYCVPIRGGSGTDTHSWTLLQQKEKEKTITRSGHRAWGWVLKKKEQKKMLLSA